MPFFWGAAGAGMQFWLEFFSIVAAIALIVQVVILGLLFAQLKRTTEHMNRLVGDLHARLGPILTRVQILLEDTQPKISSMVEDAAHVVYLARNQAQKVDRIFTDASDRLRGQLVHADRILTGALETVEEAGTQFRKSFWRPVQKVSAVVTGIKVGLDLLRSRRGGRSAHPDDPVGDEEELFI